MPLSSETIVGLVTLLVMCVPGIYILRFARRRWFIYNRRRANDCEILPVANSDRRTLSLSYDGYPATIRLKDIRNPFRRLESSPADDDESFSRGGISRYVS